MVKKYLIQTLACLGIAQTLIAEDSPPFNCCPSVIVSEPLDCTGVNPIYPYPANFAPCNSWNLFASGEFLYWAAHKDTVPTVCAFWAFDKSDYILFPQKSSYRPGFRVSMGMDLDSVILNLSYLRFHPQTTSHFSSGANGGLIFIYSPPGVSTQFANQPLAFFQTIKSSFHFGLDVALISLQHPVYFGKRIILNLSYGLLGVWISDKWRFNATALDTPPPPFVGLTASGETRSTKTTWAVGPNLGFEGTALLPCRFQLISNLNLGVQYAEQNKFHTTASYPGYRNNLGLISIGNSTIKLNSSAPHYQVWHSGDLGLGWGDYFWCDRYHFNISAKYSWVQQHIFVLYNANSPYGSELNSLHNVSVHGITISGRLDF
ncbi:MAG: hypothetical protein JSS30_01385 [Verrucomicrobia bacterium]|nr:hypothetical protein [Verrucomicrobiota bacterium]